MDVSPKLEEEDMEASGNVLEANILVMKSTRSRGALILDANKKIATKPPPTLHMAMKPRANVGSWIEHANRLGMME